MDVSGSNVIDVGDHNAVVELAHVRAESQEGLAGGTARDGWHLLRPRKGSLEGMGLGRMDLAANFAGGNGHSMDVDIVITCFKGSKVLVTLFALRLLKKF